MREWTIDHPPIPCPKCADPVHLTVGLEIPPLPDAIFWRCKTCNCAMALYLAGKAEETRIKAVAITMNGEQKDEPS